MGFEFETPSARKIIIKIIVKVKILKINFNLYNLNFKWQYNKNNS